MKLQIGTFFRALLLLSLLLSSALCIRAEDQTAGVPSGQTADAARSLQVYSDVPGLTPSTKYSFRVRTMGDGDKDWRTPFAFVTTCGRPDQKEFGYFPALADWSNTYINFEMRRPVEVEITRLAGLPIVKAVVHPAGKADSCEIRDGKAYVVITHPCLITVDINGQMDDQDTGLSRKGKYSGPPIHTLTIFANPFLENRPQPDGPGVYAVKPGEKPPSDGNWKTLYFLPGVHDIGMDFPVKPNKNYYIPGDAIVYGTFFNDDWRNGHDIHIYGYGTLSGAHIPHPKFVVPPPQDPNIYHPIHIKGALNTSVEGITVVDSAYHSIMLYAGLNPNAPTDIHWVKIFTWRPNGDGINPFNNGLIEDCFIRTQDDCMYVNGRGIRRVVTWNDDNGSAFVLSALPDRPLVVEDCDVIYARAVWNKWSGGRVFNMRAEGGGACGNGVVFRNIRVEDPRPTLQTFFVLMESRQPYFKGEKVRKPGNLSGVIFQNIAIDAPSVVGEKDILWGAEGAQIENLTFGNLTFAGRQIQSSEFFETNEFVKDIKFK